MLKHRLITASLLIPLVVLGTLYASTQVFALVTSVFVILAAWEWAGLCGWQDWKFRVGYALSFGLLLGLIYLSLRYVIIFLLISCLWWLWAFVQIGLYQYREGKRSTFSNKVNGLLGLFILLPAWMALISLHPMDQGQWVLFLLVLIWVADSAAYFVGRQWGKTKLADKISPGKTWEGVLGGLVVSVGMAWIYSALTTTTMSMIMTQLNFVLLCFLTVIASIIGDLVESLFKRQAGVKDSSQLLPGHGGVLDRIDSLTAAAPVFAMGLIFSIEYSFCGGVV